MLLSILIPAYNEEKYIISTLEDIVNYCESKKITSEIIVIDDGSTDQTYNLVSEFIERYDNISLIKNSNNLGKGGSIKKGFTESSGDKILFLDADHSVKIDNLDTFLESQADAAIASIYTDKKITIHDHNSAYRHLLRKTFHLLPVRLLGLPIHDTQRGFKLFSRDLVDIFIQKQTILGFGFDIELLVITQENNLKIEEYAVNWENPKSNKVTFKSYINIIQDMIKVFINKNKGNYKIKR